MADTNQKSKTSNTFRFKSFADRVSEIDIRRLALYHIGHENEELPEDNETYFHQTLKKWMVLNLTDEFGSFSRKCLKIVTLPQLIHQKDFVVDLLLERLSTATNLSLQPLLELLYVLARDLRDEFYPYFQRVLDRLICLLNTQDADQLEWTLVCLAHLFKTLKPYLKRNIGVVFHAILPLLDEQRYEEHVINFAVECFSFIARDIKDFKKLLDFILETIVREKVESVQGCGRLFFEIVRGVRGVFHSIAGDFLQFLFEALVDEKRKDLNQLQLLSDIINYAVLNLLNFIFPQNMGLFWTKLCSVTKETKNASRLSRLITIYVQAAQHRDGRYMAELDVVVPTILEMIESCDQANDEEALQLLGVLVSKVVLAGSAKTTQLDTCRLLKSMLAVKNRTVFEQFMLLITDHVQFDILVLPTLLKYFEVYLDFKAFELLATIVLRKQPLALNATGLENWKLYELQLKKSETRKKLEDKIKKIDFSAENIEENLLFLILVPHLSALETSPLQQILKNECLKLIKLLEEQPEISQKSITILSLVVETQIHLKFKFDGKVHKQLVDSLLPFATNLLALGCLDQLLTQGSGSVLSKEIVSLLGQTLAPLLSSHNHNLRLTSAHCLCTLHKSGKEPTPYSTFYDAECIEPNLHNYREQLLILQRLETSSEFFKSLKNETYKKDTLRFLLGILYHNFKLVWEPVLKLVEGYAKVMDLQDFWDIYKQKLIDTSEAIEKSYGATAEVTLPVDLWKSSSLNDILENVHVPPLTQQELLNYRNLLWLRLPQFGQLSEIKNRDLVTIFLKFVQDEYRSNLENREFTWNLREQNKQPMGEDDSDLEDNEDAYMENADKMKQQLLRKRKSKANSSAKSILQTLQSKMGIFVGQANPKALYREPELYAFWMDLLAGPNAQLQKVALDCVMSYKVKAHTTYRDQLYAIIDEKKFKDELVNFKLDTVNAEYRKQFMHILLRLLYGKMITKGTQRNMGSQVRKGIILRFLGQCSTDEIFWFLQMAFGKYDKYTNESVALEEIPSQIEKDFDLTCVWSPKKLQSVVNLLELVRKEFGGLMDTNFQVYMLKLLVFIGSICNEVLRADPTQMHAKMPSVFKNVKHAALQSLVNFFSHIEEFAWKTEQITCLTEVFVWPTIDRLPHESIHTPTVLLKLLLQWGEKQQHFKYLNQQHPKEQHTIFHFIIELLLNEKAKPAVRRPILGLIERLLATAEANKTMTDVDGSGLEIITPFIPHILKRLKMNFSTRSAKQALDKRDLNILSMLTSHVDEAETCDSLLQLLLPILIAKSQTNATEEVVCQVINTLSNLIKRLDEPEAYLQKIAPLFEQVQEVTARKMLCQLVADIAKKRLKQAKKKDSNVSEDQCEQLKELARILLMLNAWDKRWVEQPDYEKRLDALKEIAKKVEDDTVDMNLGVLVIYNCFYFIKYDKDMGLRDNASEHLKLLVPKLVHKYEDDKANMNYLVGDVIINLLRRLIRDNNDNVRNEGIKLLGEMARECPQAHEIFSDLAPLADKHDAEVDFFENMTHLQSHRHGRALLKFCSNAETITKTPNARTLTQFMLPLASRYLLSEKHAGKHTLVDAAIDAVGVVCQLLPWQHYHTILRYYLMKMRTTHEHQKQCVRIVVRILDAFHFDLSQSNADEQVLMKLKSELKEKVGATGDDEPLEAKIVKEEPVTKRVTEDNEDEEDDGEEKSATKEEDNLDNELDEAESDEDDENEDSSCKKETVKLEPIMKRPLLLPPNASRRVMSTIATVLIPTLNRSITEKSSYDMKHKVNRKRLSAEREEEEILRVPIALAMVKLMQKLPKELLDTSLPGVFMKVCTFLRSPLKSVRMLTRDILKKIMLTLGASYLSLLMDHLQTLLTRGFQVHVLSVTVHGVLDALRDQLQPSDLEKCLSNLLEVAMNDIFGEVTAEKEVEKIAAHTPEAKPSAKSYLVLHIAARNIRENCLLDLLMPFKDHLARSHSRKIVVKIQDCFAKIVGGLVENPHISRESLLIFIYGTMSESIVDLLPGTQKRVLSEQEKEKMRRARPDCFIIQPAPRHRVGAINKAVKTNAQANAHILIEFGLEMLDIVLKRKKLVEVDYQPFLNPILPLLRDSLKSTHIRVTTFALKCFSAIWNDEYELPALGEYLSDVVERMFEILKNFSTFGATKQEDNMQLVKSVYKAIVALLRHCTSYELTAEQIDQLILYIEQDLYEGENQVMSFSLLKAMVARKVDTPPIHDIMKKISDLSIVSHSDFVRDEARAILITYVMEYSLKQRVDQIIKYFSVQLCYKLPTGRQSAIKFIQLIIKKFPQNILAKRSEFLYLSLGTRLVNDDDPDCRKAVAECIEQLISRLEKGDRQRLFDMTLLFFDVGNKPSVREMAAALCSRFLNAEKQTFASRIKLVLPTLVARLTQNNPSAPGRFVKAPSVVGIDVNEDNMHPKRKKVNKKGKPKGLEAEELLVAEEGNEEEIARKQREIDHEIIQMQYCLLKIFEYCSSDILNNEELSHIVDELAYESQRLLAHEHSWVRCNAAKIIGLILSSYNFELVGNKLQNLKTEKPGVNPKLDYIYLNPEYDIKALVLDLCAQMIPGDTPQPMIDEILKIFLLIATMLRDVPFVTKQMLDEQKNENDLVDTDQMTKINLNWLVRNIRFLVNKEVAKAPHCISMRTALFTLIEGLITLLDVRTLEKLAPSLLATLVREMSEEDQNVEAELRQQALRVGSKLRKRIGSNTYDKLRTGAQTKLMMRRAERKKVIAQEKINDPERAAKRKIGVQERKKVSKKRKTDVIRGKAADVKKKLAKRKRKAAEDIF